MKRKKGQTLKEIKRNKVFYRMMAPYLLIFFTFTVLPIMISLFLSFTYFDIINPPKFIGLTNYIRLILHDEVFLIALRNTFILAVVVGPISYIAAFIFAWLINEL
ncbi:MAG: sugar ABC transporter permease, partial [Clostridiales bacterium]|nr:sugar ABC transporter permease [Clostridiales bacterium]